jgi:hypothetical protein
MAQGMLGEYDSSFCANAGCVLHVRPGDANVRGTGNWAELADGVLIGRQRIDAVMLCDRCAAKVLRGEMTLQRDCRLNALVSATAQCLPNGSIQSVKKSIAVLNNSAIQPRRAMIAKSTNWEIGGKGAQASMDVSIDAPASWG